MTRRILILGGTSEARRLAESLAGQTDLDVTLSLAGRTATPLPQPAPTRVGGFGGAEGLASYLDRHAVQVLVDATHPFAGRISANARRAAEITGIALVALQRPPWSLQDGDRWTMVDSVDAAVAALGSAPRRVFLTLGRQEVAAFAAAPQHFYLVRSVDPVEPPLAVPDAAYLLARGPFSEGDDRALLEEHRIGAIVAKNSGGDATRGKIVAARRLGIEVVMVERPPTTGAVVETVEQAVEAVLAHAPTFGRNRGV